MILLDTSVFIDYFRKTNRDNSLLSKVLSTNERIAISVVTHFEILIGNTEQQNSFWELILENITILDYNYQLNQQAVDTQKQLIKINKRLAFQDLLIGATAIYYNYPLATLNEKHFKYIKGLQLITPSNL
jgi:predicted nucleic acid-binding protein